MNPQSHSVVGHIHLTVADLERSLRFYRDLLGFSITSRYGDSAVFLSAGGYHHHIGLNTWNGIGAPSAPPGYTGMYHVAFLYPDRRSLATVLKRLMDVGYELEGAADHGVSEAIYLRDPDNNGVELYVDRPKEQWQVSNDGMVEMVTERLDLNNLLAEAQESL